MRTFEADSVHCEEFLALGRFHLTGKRVPGSSAKSENLVRRPGESPIERCQCPERGIAFNPHPKFDSNRNRMFVYDRSFS